MLISTFNTQLKKKYPQAEAYVPEKVGKRQNNTVCLIYSPNSKVYEYKGTILSVAECLNLIPQIDYEAESKSIANQLKSGTSKVIGHDGCQDTIRWLLNQSIDYDDAGNDEFDRPLLSFKISTGKSEWL